MCMKKLYNVFFLYPLFSGGLIMVVGSNATNFINYVYHIFMGRILGPSYYGELAALLSFISILGIIPFSLGLVIIKFISSTKDEKQISVLTVTIGRKLIVLSVVIFVGISLLSPFIASFLNISNYFLVIITGLGFTFSLLSFFYKSILQGLLKFNQFILSQITENLFKLILGVVLVLMGYSINGAILGLIIAFFIGLLLSRYFIRDYIKETKKISFNLKPLIAYSLPVLIQSFAATSLITSDLLLVKHFFPQHEAGIYAAVSNLGKIIFFGSGPISAVMFPLVAKKHAIGEKYLKLFLFSLGLTVILCFFILSIYFLFPEFAIAILYGSPYFAAKSYLLEYSFFISLFTISSLLVNFYLSLGVTRIVVLPFIAALTQAIGIWFFHDNLDMVIWVSVIAALFLLLSLFSSFAFVSAFKKR